MKIVTESNCELAFIEAAEKSIEESLAKSESSGMTLQDIADKHSVPLEQIEKELEIGIEVELEHTTDKELARKIAMDHLAEMPDYYTRLKAMEEEGEGKQDEGQILPKLQKYLTDTKEDWNYILPEDLKKEGLGKFFILDLRKPEDFKQGHIPGATNIFWLDLLSPENLKKIPKDKRILLVCYVGHTSSQAMVLLRLLGYDVTSLKYGMGEPPKKGTKVAGWDALGYETEK